jgi:hypothetical protein
MASLQLLEPSDADLQRTWDLLRSQRDPPNPVAFARAVLRRWGVTVLWAPSATAESQPQPQLMTEALKAVLEQQARADRLEELFLADGRDKASHPSKGLFTGLLAAASAAAPEEPAP